MKKVFADRNRKQKKPKAVSIPSARVGVHRSALVSKRDRTDRHPWSTERLPMSTCQYVNMSTCQYVNIYVNIYVNMLHCVINMSTCQRVTGHPDVQPLLESNLPPIHPPLMIMLTTPKDYPLPFFHPNLSTFQVRVQQTCPRCGVVDAVVGGDATDVDAAAVAAAAMLLVVVLVLSFVVCCCR